MLIEGVDFSSSQAVTGIRIGRHCFTFSPTEGDLLWALLKAQGERVDTAALPGKSYASQKVIATKINSKIASTGLRVVAEQQTLRVEGMA